jgi:PAS domain S-box-containing protein
MAKKLSDRPVPAHRLDKIIQSLPLGVHLYDLREDKLIFAGANKTADEILGIRHSTLIGKTLEAAFPPLSDTEIPVQYKKVAVSGIAYEAEQVDYKDEKISGAFQVYAIQIESGKIAVMFRDITEKKKADEVLRKSEEKLRQYNAELVETKKELDDSLQSLAAVNKSLLEMKISLENANADLKSKNEEFCKLNQDYEIQNEQLKKTNIILEDIIYSISYASGTFEYISPVTL